MIGLQSGSNTPTTTNPTTRTNSDTNKNIQRRVSCPIGEPWRLSAESGAKLNRENPSVLVMKPLVKGRIH